MYVVVIQWTAMPYKSDMLELCVEVAYLTQGAVLQEHPGLPGCRVPSTGIHNYVHTTCSKYILI